MIVEVSLPLNIEKVFCYESDTDIRLGCRVIVPFRNKNIVGVVTGFSADTGMALKKVISILDETPLITSDLMELAGWISKYYMCSFGAALNLIVSDIRPTQGKKNDKKISVAQAADIQLNAEQKDSVSKIISSLKNPESTDRTFLLHGLNDSGKTEVYIRAIEWCITNGFSAIFMVPDVSLISQFKQQFSERFGDSMAVWHSGLSKSAKNRFIWRLEHGEIKVVIGTRSAVLLPIKKAGLLILDEEDDEFYKNIQTPKYNAAEVAIKRAEICGGVVVLGTATPSVETYFNMTKGQIKLLELSGRVRNSPMPGINVVDMRKFGKYVFSIPLKNAVNDALAAGRQVFFLVNRRGWFGNVRCLNCGYAVMCPKCSVSLTIHKNPLRFLCHYCGYKREPVKYCPKCNSILDYSGRGTERIEELSLKFFPGRKIVRIDSDSAKSYDMAYKIMKSGEPCILIGTQIAAKGFDFPNLTVTGILNADTGLSSSDYRAGERVFSLLTHAVGRTGRADLPGKVIIQTYNPEHYVIKSVTGFDFKGFYEKEIEFRKEFFWPPFAKLIAVTILGKTEKTVIEVSEKFAESLREIKNIDVLGPVPKMVPYLSGKHRWQILVKYDKELYPDTPSLISEAANKLHGKKDTNIIFDVDPAETS
ncbi:MAG: Primosomal protein N' [Elusimicrobia bacterium ADurb.Bin231]|nr:MAG: Primosomal protein N' [Elusimicrobia bacterium ADurb.Bin231]